MNRESWRKVVKGLLPSFEKEFKINYSSNLEKQKEEKKQVRKDVSQILETEFLIYLSAVRVLRKEEFTLDDVSAVLSGHYEILSDHVIEESSYVRMVYKGYANISVIKKNISSYFELIRNKDYLWFGYESYFVQGGSKREFRIREDIKMWKLRSKIIDVFKEKFMKEDLIEKSKSTYTPFNPRQHSDSIAYIYSKHSDKSFLFNSKEKNQKRHYGIKKEDAKIKEKFLPESVDQDRKFSKKRSVSLKEKKKKLSTGALLSNEDYQLAAKQLNKYIKDNEEKIPPSYIRNWKEEAKKIEVLNKEGFSPYLDVTKPIHFLGGMGQGKSTFVELELERMLRVVGGVRVGIITKTTEETIDQYILLRMKGYKVGLIIGSNSEKEHLKNFLGRVKENKDLMKYEKYAEIIFELTGLMGGNCLMKTLSFPREIMDKEEKNPCFDISIENPKEEQEFVDLENEFDDSENVEDEKEGKKRNFVKVSCPFYKTCGVHDRDLGLLKSEIWIGTMQAILKSRTSKFVDPYTRTYFELMSDYCDAIIGDEADLLQNVSDDQTLDEELILAEDGGDIFGDIRKDYNEIIKRVGQKLRKETALNKLLDLIGEGERVVRRLYEEIMRHSGFYKRNYKGRTFNSRIMLRKMFYHLASIGDLDQSVIDEWLETHYAQSMHGSEENFSVKNLYTIPFREITGGFDEDIDVVSDLSQEVRRQRKLEAHLKVWSESLGINIPLDALQDQNIVVGNADEFLNDKEIILTTFYTHLALYLTEYYYFLLKTRLTYIAMIYEAYPIGKSSSMRFKFRGEAKLSLNNKAVNFYLKYNSKKKQKIDVVELSIVENKGIGRTAIFDYNYLNYKEQEETSTLILLSATSNAPDSTHYNIEVEQEYLLKNVTSTRPEITQTILDSDIVVSGSNDILENMKEINFKYKDLIDEELGNWSESERKVLIVVNSYEQAYEVAKNLAVIMPHNKIGYYGKKGKAFYRTVDRDNLTGIFSKQKLAKIENEEIDVLVVPLLSMNRGYNILKEKGGKKYSYFGSVFFYIRPLLNIELTEAVKIINANSKRYYNELEDLVNGEAWRYIQKRAELDLGELIKSRDSWTNILKTKDPVFIKAIGWYTFINAFQMMGRLQRGDNPSYRVFYADIKFLTNSIKINKKTDKDNEWLEKGMLEVWFECLEEAKRRNPLYFEDLYAPFYDSLSDALGKNALTEEMFL